jgi:hypothetical protein
VQEILECGTGEVSFAGDVTGTRDFSMQGTITFANCEGLNGALAITAEGTVSGSQIASIEVTLAVTLHGSISADDCAITFHTFAVHTTADAFGIPISPVIANGGLSASCAGDNISCTLSSIDLNNEDAFINSCSGSS